jgi:hypothetical protein
VLDFAELCSGVVAAGSYVEVTSEAFTVTPGDVVYFTLMKDEGPALSIIQVVPATETV